MKRVIGILMIIGGLWLIAGAIATVNDVERMNNTPRGRLGRNLSPAYSSGVQHQQENAAIMGGAGVLLLVFGIIFTASKQKQTSSNSYSSGSRNNSSEVSKLYKRAIQLYNKGDYTGTIPVLKYMIQLSPKDEKTYFNLACCYSLTENKECFKSIEDAVNNGYSDFNKIRSYDALKWMRQQEEWTSFENNGFELKPIVQETEKPQPKNEVSEDHLTKLERLGELKQKGLLTEEEFQEQKKKILERMG